jgi:hypothetical protein
MGVLDGYWVTSRPAGKPGVHDPIVVAHQRLVIDLTGDVKHAASSEVGLKARPKYLGPENQTRKRCWLHLGIKKRTQTVRGHIDQELSGAELSNGENCEQARCGLARYDIVGCD